MSLASLKALARVAVCFGLGGASCLGQQNFSLRVTVVDKEGAAIRGAEVRIVGIDRPGILTPNGVVSFKEVPPGSYQVSAAYPGFRDKVVQSVVITEGKTTELIVKMEQAPPKASDYKLSDELSTTRLYEKKLTDIGQPLLCPESVTEGKEWYRFLYVPTFFPPTFLRMDIDPDGTAVLLAYVWKGAGGYDWGKYEKKSRKLTWEEENDLFGTLADVGFWTLPAQVQIPPDMVILDGTDWFLEGVKDGRCHVVTRYSSPLTSLFARQMLGVVAKIKPYSGGDQ